jgi:transposase
MATRHDLTLEEKIQLIRDNNAGKGLSFRKLSTKYHCSIGSISNILKRKDEYLSDYETNRNKDTKRKLKDDTSLRIDEITFEWFSSQRAKNIPISGLILQEKARQIAEEIGVPAGQFKGSNGWLEKFRTRHFIKGTPPPGWGCNVK